MLGMIRMLENERWAEVYILDIVPGFSSLACTRTYWSCLVMYEGCFVTRTFARFRWNLCSCHTLTVTSLPLFRRDCTRILQDV